MMSNLQTFFVIMENFMFMIQKLIPIAISVMSILVILYIYHASEIFQNTL
jgi:hypothetical protein